MRAGLTILALFRGLAALDPLLFLFLAGLAGLFRLLSSKSQKSNRTYEPPEPQTRPELPRREVSTDTDEERIRRFLEALGQPPSAEPPPPVRPRPVETFPQPERAERARTVRPSRNLLSPLPPLTTSPPPLPRQVRLPGQITRPPYKEKSFVPPPAKKPAFEVHKGEGAPKVDKPLPIRTPGDAYAVATTPVPVAAAKPSRLVIELRTPDALQKAIVLREILGPPPRAPAAGTVGSFSWLGRQLACAARLRNLLFSARRRGGTGRRAGLKIQ